MSASSCTSQSTALRVKARFSGAVRTKRSLAKSRLPTTAIRPRVLPPLSAGATTAPSRRLLRSACGKSWVGAMVVAVVYVPVARLETSSGVTVPFAAPVVSIVLAQVTTIAPRS